jgi:hypothetical protein
MKRPERLDLRAHLGRIGDFVGVGATADVTAGKLVSDGRHGGWECSDRAGEKQLAQQLENQLCAISRKQSPNRVRSTSPAMSGSVVASRHSSIPR